MANKAKNEDFQPKTETKGPFYEKCKELDQSPKQKYKSDPQKWCPRQESNL